MIKVLYIVDAMTYMGTQTHIAAMMRGHDKSRFKPYLLCLQEKGPLGEILESEGYPVTAYDLKRVYAVKAARSYLRLIPFLRREGIDVVHSYLFSAQFYGVPAARLAGVPLVIAGRRIMGVYWRARKYAAARRISNLLSDLLVANSYAVKDFVVREEGVAQGKVRVVYNGVDAERFCPPPSGIEGRTGEPITVGYVGSLSAAKQVDVLLRAAKRLPPGCPAFRIQIIGKGLRKSHPRWEGKTDLRIKSLAEELGLMGRVEFLEPVERIENHIKKMDIFVMPSVSEGMSNAVLEAMATGLPVLATDSGGNREVVVNDRTGYLFPSGDDGRLAELMLDLLRNREKRFEMGKAGRERVLERFTAKRMVGEMERLYEEELLRRRR